LNATTTEEMNEAIHRIARRPQAIVLRDMLGNPFPEYTPYYCGDLNAMHEAERTLTEVQRNEYVRYLAGNTEGSAAFATAYERAKAFLKVFDK
jgi:hypothetical protein